LRRTPCVSRCSPAKRRATPYRVFAERRHELASSPIRSNRYIRPSGFSNANDLGNLRLRFKKRATRVPPINNPSDSRVHARISVSGIRFVTVRAIEPNPFAPRVPALAPYRRTHRQRFPTQNSRRPAHFLKRFSELLERLGRQVSETLGGRGKR